MAIRYSWDVELGTRGSSFMVEAWAKDITLGVISSWTIFEAMSLDDITEIGSIDRDKKLYSSLRHANVKKSGRWGGTSKEEWEGAAHEIGRKPGNVVSWKTMFKEVRNDRSKQEPMATKNLYYLAQFERKIPWKWVKYICDLLELEDWITRSMALKTPYYERSYVPHPKIRMLKPSPPVWLDLKIGPLSR